MGRWEGGKPREWRWSSLVQVLRALLLREEPLRVAWSKDRFGDIGTTAKIDEALTSELFWTYARALSLVAGVLDVQSSYCEGCSCHEHEGLKHKGHAVRARELEQRLRCAVKGNVNEALPYPPSCPLKNRRSAELASGAFEKFLQEAMVMTKERLLTFRGTLKPSEWQTVLKDYMAASVA